MKSKKIKVTVTLHSGILDAEGTTIQKYLAARAGYREVEQVRVGKVFEIKWRGRLTKKARQKVQELAASVFSNPIMQDCNIEWPS